MTAEIAVALPALILVAAALVWLIAVLGAHVLCADAAREAVRAAARGDDAGAVRALAAEIAPGGSVVEVSSGETVRAVVTARVNAPGPLASLLPAMTVTGSAVALPETGALGGPETGALGAPETGALGGMAPGAPGGLDLDR